MELWEEMLEVSRVGVAQSDDDEIELSLELSIGGSYGKCDKPRQDNERVIAIARPGFGFSEAEQAEAESQSTGSAPEAADPCRKREIQALRRLEARRKREERMRKSTVCFRGIINNNYDKAGLEAQQFQDRAQCRKLREDETFLDDSRSGPGRKREQSANFLMKIDEPAVQNHGIVPLRLPFKNGFSHPYASAATTSLGCGGARKGENEMKETFAFQPTVSCGSFRPYVNGNGVHNYNNNNVRQNQGRIVNQNVVSNGGSLEKSSSAISDYRSTSGKGGSISDTGSHSGCLQTRSREALNHEVNGTMRVAKNITPSKESECALASSKPDFKVDPSPSNPENPTPSSPPKQYNNNEASDRPSKNQTTRNGGGALSRSLSQMPCVSTTGNGPNGKTITGLLYRYTKTEVSIVCVCHGSSFSPAEFVEHAGGTDISNPLRHITVVPSSIG